MKKNVLKLAMASALLFTVTGAQAQVDLGVKAGGSFASLAGSFSKSTPANNNYDLNAGPAALVYGEYHLSKVISFQLGVGYANQGGKRTGMQAYYLPSGNGSIAYSNLDSKTNLSYITIPVLAKFSYDLGGNFAVYADAGPYVSFLAAAKQKNTGNSRLYADANGTQVINGESNPLKGDNIDIKDQFQTFNFGAQVDLGAKYTIAGRHSVFVEVGGNYGFLNVMKDAYGEARTTALTANVGYAFQLVPSHTAKTTAQ